LEGGGRRRGFVADTVLEALECGRETESEILGIIGEIRDVFENHFDRTWFSLLIDDMPIDLRTVREIRHVVSLKRIYDGEEKEIWQGVRDLEEFVTHVRRYFLPLLRERLRISRLFPAQRVTDRTQLIIRTFVAFTFPYNLERLRILTSKLKARLLFHYPFLETGATLAPDG
jgi:hypothetical protein